MVACSDGATHALGLADRPILIEGGSSLNRWLVDALVQVDIVGATVTGNGALVGASGGWVVVTVGFDDVIFNEGIGHPSINREIRVSCKLVRTSPTEGSSQASPSGLKLPEYVTELRKR
jgi:hypothetical protein